MRLYQIFVNLNASPPAKDEIFVNVKNEPLVMSTRILPRNYGSMSAQSATRKRVVCVQLPRRAPEPADTKINLNGGAGWGQVIHAAKRQTLGLCR
jgi:hypothetical protein